MKTLGSQPKRKRKSGKYDPLNDTDLKSAFTVIKTGLYMNFPFKFLPQTFPFPLFSKATATAYRSDCVYAVDLPTWLLVPRTLQKLVRECVFV